MSTNILSKIKQKTEDACISHWQKVSSKGSTITKSFYRISTSPQAIAKKTPKKSNITNLIKKLQCDWLENTLITLVGVVWLLFYNYYLKLLFYNFTTDQGTTFHWRNIYFLIVAGKSSCDIVVKHVSTETSVIFR